MGEPAPVEQQVQGPPTASLQGILKWCARVRVCDSLLQIELLKTCIKTRGGNVSDGPRSGSRTGRCSTPGMGPSQRGRFQKKRGNGSWRLLRRVSIMSESLSRKLSLGRILVRLFSDGARADALSLMFSAVTVPEHEH